MFSKLINYAEDYIRSLDIVDFGIIKICLVAFGIMVGATVSQNNKRGIMFGSGIIFMAAFIWTMMKFLGIDCCGGKEQYSDFDEDYDWAE